MSTEETPSGARTPGDDGPRDPDLIQAEIEETREELGETVAALAEKADVKAQAKKKVDETKATAQEKVASVTEAAKAKASEFTSSSSDESDGGGGSTAESAQAAAAQAAQAARENPVHSAAVGALVLGLFIGWLFGRR